MRGTWKRLSGGCNLLAVGLALSAAGCDSPLVTSPPVVGSIQVSTPTHVLGARDTLRLAAIVRDTAGTVIPHPAVQWRSLDSTVATVDSSGLVTGRQKGTVWITASSGGHSHAVSLSIFEARVTFVPDSVVLTSQEPARWGVRLENGSEHVLGASAEFSISDTTIARIEGCGGRCTGSNRGTTIYVYSKKSGTAEVIAQWLGAADTAVLRVQL